MTDSNNFEPVYLPSNEPYLGRQSVYQFDQIILAYLEKDAQYAAYTQNAVLTDLQKAACQIIPQGANLALTIRELVRQGYLFGAAVLMRSFIERVAIISYLHKHPDAIVLWQKGWNYNGKDKRPSLKKMVDSMGENFKGDINAAGKVVELFNHITHGDPIGSQWNLVNLGDKGLGYSVSKALNEPELCDFICFNALSYLIVLMAMRDVSFPNVNKQRK